VTTFTDGNTLTGAQLEAEFNAIRTDINAKTGADLNNGSVPNVALANPQAYFTITVPCIKDADALATGAIATAEAGLGNGLTNQDFSFRLAVNATLIAITAGCQDAASAAGTRNNDATVVQAATLLTATTAQFPDSGGQNTTTLTTSVDMTTAQALLIRCNTDSGTNDGVVGPYVILHFQSNHQATA
tara:strand:- start:1083 stop:1643 length:561 start_codon:yes stop_codon:yes gene_type:complete